MRLLGRCLIFLLGFGLAGAVLFALEVKFHRSWQPIMLGILYCTLLAYQDWRPKTVFLIPHCGAFLSGCYALWLYSENGSRFGGNQFLSLALGSSAALAATFGVGAVVGFFVLDKPQRRAAIGLTLLLLLAWMICYASSSAGGADPMIAFIQARLGFSFQQADIAVKVFRKSIHFLFYGTVAFTASRTALAAGAQRKLGLLFGFLIALNYAGFDEMRQSSSARRTGTPWDVLLDMAGATAFLCIPVRRKGVRSNKDRARS